MKELEKHTNNSSPHPITELKFQRGEPRNSIFFNLPLRFNVPPGLRSTVLALHINMLDDSILEILLSRKKEDSFFCSLVL